MKDETIKVNLDETPDLSTAEREEVVINQAAEQGKISKKFMVDEETIHRIDFGKMTDEDTENVNNVDSPVTVIEEPNVMTVEAPIVDKDDPYAAYDDEAIGTDNLETQLDDNTINTSTIEEPPKHVLPENLQKLMDFMEDTGGTLEDYVRLNTDYSNADEATLLKEYYRKTKPHLDASEIDFLIEDKFAFDEDYDDERSIRKKQLAMKEELVNARKFLDEVKEQYYTEVKGNRSKLPEDVLEAVDFYDKYSKEQAELTKMQELKISHFQNETKKVFDDFKGFEFKVGDKEFKYEVKNPKAVMNYQSDITNFVKEFLNEEGMMKNASGYHKALFAAKNADSLAAHFYEQGKADMLKEVTANSKNIDMGARGSHEPVVDVDGIKVKALNGDSGSKLRIQLRR